MCMSFLNALQQTTNVAYTENGAVSNRGTLDPVLDFFSRAGAMRENVDEAVKLFTRAYAEDPKLAVKALFYMRDVRGGQGERTLFRQCLKALPSEVQNKVMRFIPEYGRWDDLLLLDPNLTIGIVKKQLEEDEKNMAEGNSVSLLAKWLPSENASSNKTSLRAMELMKLLELKPSQYRKKIVALRKHIKILEHQMSSKQWGEVDYEKIPSQAHRKHVKAFKRNDTDRYTKYLEEVEEGTKKIKTSTLYTYEVFDTVSKDEQAANAMWSNLPDYTNGTNALVVADVSGSMSGRPMSISVSLALYFAERNKGVFNGYFMTFSESPQLHKVLGSSLTQKLSNIENSQWGMNTNLEKAFQAILEAAVRDKCPQEEMPKVLYIISDMEFDACVSTSETNFNNAKRMFEESGYKLPHVVFWNVSSRNDQVPATKYDNGVTLISGSSQSTFRYAVEGKDPLTLMNEVLNSERYRAIEL